jgi:hypothetical protein
MLICRLLSTFALVVTTFLTLSHCSNLQSSDYLLNFDEFGITDELYGGYMPIDLIDNQEGSFFFLLSKQRHSMNQLSNNNQQKLIIWLNGVKFQSNLVLTSRA